MSQLEVKITKVVPAPRQRVFDAWLDPEALAQFMLPAPGMSVPRVETDPRVGGQFLIVMKMGDKELPHRGEYRTVEPPEKLAFTWLSAHAGEGSLVTLTFRELSPTQTELTLHHVGLDNEESRSNHEGGWTSIVDQLARLLG